PYLASTTAPTTGVAMTSLGAAARSLSRLTRYRVLRPLARGGMGQVSVALDEELQREVALKELLPQASAEPAQHGRFLREAEVTSQLEHPGVPPIYGLGIDSDGRPCYAMRLVTGDTLQEVLAGFHQPPRPVAWDERW